MTENRSLATRTTDFVTDLGVRDYIAIARVRKFWIILTAVAVIIPAVILATRLPNVYQSATVILIDAQKVPDSYIPTTVSARIDERLAAIKEQVMSATRMSKLIESMHLYPELRGKVSDSEIISRMQKAITVETVTQGGRQLSAFRIAYAGRNAVEVAQVTNQIAAMFIEENLKAREQQSFGTASFIANELQKTKEQLDQKEAEIQRVKQQNIMDLPESSQFHVQAMDSLRMQIRESQDRVSRAQQQKVYLQSMMATTAPTVDVDGSAASPYQAQIQKLESQLGELRSRYGANHPDVRKVKSELDDLKARRAEQEREGGPAQIQSSPGRARNPVIEAQIAKIEEEIAQESKRQQSLQNEIQFHISKLGRVPLFEQQMASQMRDYDTLRKYYNELLDKKLYADTASSMETRQKGERFVILDPAQVAEKPAGPKRWLIALAGIFGGILAGLGVAFLRELSDSIVRNEQEAASIAGLVILARIPQVPTRKDRRGRFMRLAAASASVVIASVAIGLAATHIATRYF